MRTLIQGGWVVGYEGAGHVLIRDGCVVFEGDTVVHVGKAFTGSVDRTIDARGKLVSPGFVNCHLHAAVNAGTRSPGSTLGSVQGRHDAFNPPEAAACQGQPTHKTGDAQPGAEEHRNRIDAEQQAKTQTEERKDRHQPSCGPCRTGFDCDLAVQVNLGLDGAGHPVENGGQRRSGLLGEVPCR